MSGWLLALQDVDEQLLRAFVVRRRRTLDTAVRTLTKLGNPQLVIPFTLVLAFGAVPALYDAGVLAAFSLTLSHLAVHLMKRRFARARPRLPVGLGFMIEPEDRFSFPSGHAAAGLSVALPICLAVGGPWGAAALALGALVGVTRCYLGVHYPGDVVAGWALAALSVAAFSPWLGV